MINFLYKSSLGLVSVINFVHYVGGAILHLYTVYLFFEVFGTWQALVSLFLPFISQIYLAYQIIITAGWNNLYLILLGLYILTYPLGFLVSSLAVYAEKRITATATNKRNTWFIKPMIVGISIIVGVVSFYSVKSLFTLFESKFISDEVVIEEDNNTVEVTSNIPLLNSDQAYYAYETKPFFDEIIKEHNSIWKERWNQILNTTTPEDQIAYINRAIIDFESLSSELNNVPNEGIPGDYKSLLETVNINLKTAIDTKLELLNILEAMVEVNNVNQDEYNKVFAMIDESEKYISITKRHLEELGIKMLGGKYYDIK